MAIRFTVRSWNRKYVLSIRPVALPWLYDRMSIILEIRTRIMHSLTKPEYRGKEVLSRALDIF